MSLIINKKIKKMLVGFPTVSDKYDVTGGILTGSYEANFGDIVKLENSGYFSVVNASNTISAATDIKGIILGTNVKLADEDNVVKVKVGEAFNLMMRGFMAVKVASITGLVANGQVYATAAGAFTPVSTSNYAVANAVFTGEYENQGTAASPVYVAEILIK